MYGLLTKEELYFLFLNNSENTEKKYLTMNILYPILRNKKARKRMYSIYPFTKTRSGYWATLDLQEIRLFASEEAKRIGKKHWITLFGGDEYVLINEIEHLRYFPRPCIQAIYDEHGEEICLRRIGLSLGMCVLAIAKRQVVLDTVDFIETSIALGGNIDEIIESYKETNWSFNPLACERIARALFAENKIRYGDPNAPAVDLCDGYWVIDTIQTF